MSSAGSSGSKEAGFLASSLKGRYAATYRVDVWASHDRDELSLW